MRNWLMDFDLNFKKISEEYALNLESNFTLQEIKEAIWSCDDSKATNIEMFWKLIFQWLSKENMVNLSGGSSMLQNMANTERCDI
ncbi:hypothetical protein V6N13_121971 [Hibiscus sabdariffa]